MNESENIELGAFTLEAVLGKGGMATVWRGSHRALGAPVAVKVMTRDMAGSPTALRAFRREVHAAAGLDHPSIITLYDFGLVDGAASDASGGNLIEGSPYFAMELASPQTIREIENLDWRTARHVLLQILDALSHAHARGVVHRDLKHDNVLLSNSGGGLPSVKLSDFGIAHIIDYAASPDEAGKTAGTPSYMAPEQLQGLWRDYGPWTDLYALGCMAYELFSGNKPYKRSSTRALVEAHLHAPIPELKPRFLVPEGLEPWIWKLMAKAPGDRFQRAADAARELLKLTVLSAGPEPEEVTSPLLVMKELQSEVEQTLIWADAAASWTTTTHTTSARVATSISAFPTSWGREEPAQRAMQLVGAGLGLYGLRPVPVVDRLPERDAIWEALARVRRTGRAELILLAGEAGLGKKRIAKWMSERADELGLVQVMHTTLGPASTSTDGLPQLIGRWAGCLGLTRAQIFERLSVLAPPAPGGDAAREEMHLLALTELLSPLAVDATSTGGPRRVKFGNPAVRHVAVHRLLAQICQERPVMIVVNDVQWGADLLDFCGHLLEWQARLPTPLLAVFTVGEQALATRPVEIEKLRRLRARQDVQQWSLGPLDRADHLRLVEGLLRLEGTLAATVAERTDGNPLFAVQLVGDWVHRGVLEAGERGFALKAGEDAVLPDDIHAVWTRRLEDLADDIGVPAADVIQVLEVAAALGREVDDRALREASAKAGLELSPGLVDALIGRGLAVSSSGEEGSWTFGHTMLRESLERSARAAGRWERCHRAWVNVLRVRFDAESPELMEQLARHQVAAGSPGEAIAPLLVAARNHLRSGDFRRALQALMEREEALLSSQVPMDDLRWLEGWLEQAEAALKLDDLELASRHVEQAAVQMQMHASAQFGSDRVAADLLRLRARIAERQGDGASANRFYDDAIQLYHSEGEGTGLASCLIGQGRMLVDSDPERAAMYFEGALELSESAGTLGGVGESLLGLSDVCRAMGDWGRAREILDRATTYHDHAGDRFGKGLCLLKAGQIEREAGHPERALTRLDEASKVFEELGARKELVTVYSSLVQCEASRGQWESVKGHAHSVEGLLEAQVSSPLLSGFEESARLAESAGQSALASTLRELAGR